MLNAEQQMLESKFKLSLTDQMLDAVFCQPIYLHLSCPNSAFTWGREEEGSYLYSNLGAKVTAGIKIGSHARAIPT